MKKQIVCFLLLVMIMSSILTVAMAVEYPIAPCYNNTAATSTGFVLNTTGKATITASYDGFKNITTGATVTSYIEKKTLGLFWFKVDIGETNNEWVDVSSDYADTFIHTFQLEDTGTYRCTVVYEISGTGGATDVIEYEQERTYS